jgi:integrase
LAVGAGQDRHRDQTSRRTLALPQLAVTALRALHNDKARAPGELVFCIATGQPLDTASVRRFFRAVCSAAGIGPGWTARELRHTFVSLMSDSDVAVEEIARVVGHASSKVTETVYRHQLRPVMTTAPRKWTHYCSTPAKQPGVRAFASDATDAARHGDRNLTPNVWGQR